MASLPDHTRSGLRKFLRGADGSTITAFAMAAPLLFVAMAAASDTASWYNTKARLQRAADTAALGAARELTLANRDNAAIVAAANRYASAHLGHALSAGAQVSAQVVDGGTGVRVDVTRSVEPMLGRFLPESPVVVRATATGRVSGSANICAIGLSASESGTISFKKSSRLTAQACAVYSNSAAADGLELADSSNVRSALLCSAGGANKAPGAIVNPSPTLDCPAIADPLAGRPEPAVGGCDHVDRVIATGSVTLSPGTYCGGLTVTDTANVTLLSGVYILKDGSLVASKTATLQGTNVGFYFRSTSKKSHSRIKFDKLSTINLTAPKDGPLAGILFFESKTNLETMFQITSDNARVLLGTIYLPVSGLQLDGQQPVADQSAYTVIIARTIKLDEGPNLYLNANYGQTDIPVPQGVGPVGRVIKLGS